MGQTQYLQTWTAVAGDGVSVVQDQEGWLDVTDWKEVAIYTKVAFVTPQGLTTKLQIQTSEAMVARSSPVQHLHGVRRPAGGLALMLAVGLAMTSTACAADPRASTGCTGDDGDLHIIQIAVGSGQACLLLSDGRVMCWGDDTNGYLGIPDRRMYYKPELLNLRDICEIAGGGTHTCARRKNGQLYCWGDNIVGGLGDGYGDWYDSPAEVYGERDTIHVWAGGSTCDQRADASIACWGSYVGDGTDNKTAIPTDVHTLPPIQTMGLGDSSCAIDADGVAWCWGLNWLGSVGVQQHGNVLTPTRLGGLPPLVAVTPRSPACGRTFDGDVWCWGENRFGGVGRGYTSSDPVPPSGPVNDLHGVVSVSPGSGFACALIDDGSIYCWGYNGTGSLGDGTSKDRHEPVLSQVTNARMISTLTYAVCAVDTSDRLFCWGGANDDLLGEYVFTSYDPIEIDWRSGLEGR